MSTLASDLTVAIGADISGLERGLAQAGAALGRFTDQGGRTDAVSHALNQAATAADHAAKILDELEKEEQQAAAGAAKLAQSSEQASTAASRLGSAFGSATKMAAGFAAGQLGVQTAQQAVVSAFKGTVGAAADFEQKLNMLQAVSGATAGQMGQISAQAKALGADISLPATSATDAAAAMLELSKAGLSVNDTMAAAQGVLQMAAAGQLDNAQAAEIAANALNAFHLAGSEATRVADLLAASANASSAEVTDVALSLQQASAVAASAHIPIEDLVTAIGEMANAGIKGSDAGTSLKTMVLALQAPTDQAASKMAELGINVRDAEGHMLPLRDIIGVMSQKLGALGDAQRDAALKTIFGTDAIRAANVVMMGGVATFDQMKEATTKQGAAADLAAAQMKGFNGAIAALSSNAETIGVAIGQRALPALTALVNVLNAGLSSGAVIELGHGLEAVASGAGVLLGLLGGLPDPLRAAGAGFVALNAAAFLLVTNPVGAAIAGIGVALVGLGYYADHVAPAIAERLIPALDKLTGTAHTTQKAIDETQAALNRAAPDYKANADAATELTTHLREMEGAHKSAAEQVQFLVQTKATLLAQAADVSGRLGNESDEYKALSGAINEVDRAAKNYGVTITNDPTPEINGHIHEAAQGQKAMAAAIDQVSAALAGQGQAAQAAGAQIAAAQMPFPAFFDNLRAEAEKAKKPFDIMAEGLKEIERLAGQVTGAELQFSKTSSALDSVASSAKAALSAADPDSWKIWADRAHEMADQSGIAAPNIAEMDRLIDLIAQHGPESAGALDKLNKLIKDQKQPVDDASQASRDYMKAQEDAANATVGMAGTLEDLRDTLKSFVDAFMIELGRVPPSAKDAMQLTKDAVTIDLSQPGADAALTYASGFKDRTVVVTQAGEEVATSLGGAVKVDLDAPGADAALSFASGIGAKQVAVYKSGQLIATTAAGALGELLVPAAGAGESGGAAYAGGIAGTSGQANQAGAAVASQAGTGLETLTGQAPGVGQSAGASYASGLSGTSGQANAAGAAVAASAQAGLNTADGTSAGYNLAAGFAAGIRSGQNLAYVEALGLAHAANGALTGFLDIASPSKLMMKHGRWTAQGFAMGIADGVPLVAAAMGDVTTITASVLRDGLIGVTEEYAPVWEQSWARFSNAVMRTGQVFVDELRGLPDVFMTYFSTALQTGDAFNDWLTHLPVQVRDSVGRMGEYLVASTGAWRESSQQITQAASDTGTALAQMGDATDEVIGVTEEGLPVLLNAWNEYVHQVQHGGSLVNDALGALPDVFGKYVAAVLEDGDYLNDWITHLPPIVQDAMRSMAQSLVENGTVWGAWGESAESTADQAVAAFNAWAATGPDLATWQDYADNLTDSLTQLAAGVDGVIQEDFSFVSQSVADVAGAARAAAPALDGLTGSVSSAIPAFSDFAAQIAGSRVTDPLKDLNAQLRSLKVSIAEVEAQLAVAPKDSALAASLQATLDGLNDQKKAIDANVAAIKAQQEGLEESKTALDGFWEALRNDEQAAALATQFGKAGGDAIAKLKEAFEQDGPEAGKALEGLVQKLAQQARDTLGPTGGKIGDDLIAAFGNALATRTPEAVQAVLDLVGRLQQATGTASAGFFSAWSKLFTQDQHAQAAGETGGSIIDALLGDLGDPKNGEQIAEKLHAMIDAAVTASGPTAAALANAVWEAVSEALANPTPETIAAAENGITQLWNITEQKLNEAFTPEKFLRAMNADLLDQYLTERIPSAFKGAMDAAQTVFTDGTAKASDALASGLAGIRATLQDKLPPDVFASAWKRIWDAADAFTHDRSAQNLAWFQSETEKWGEIANFIPQNFAKWPEAAKSAFGQTVAALDDGVISINDATDRIHGIDELAGKFRDLPATAVPYWTELVQMVESGSIDSEEAMRRLSLVVKALGIDVTALGDDGAAALAGLAQSATVNGADIAQALDTVSDRAKKAKAALDDANKTADEWFKKFGFGMPAPDLATMKAMLQGGAGGSAGSGGQTFGFGDGQERHSGWKPVSGQPGWFEEDVTVNGITSTMRMYNPAADPGRDPNGFTRNGAVDPTYGGLVPAAQQIAEGGANIAQGGTQIADSSHVLAGGAARVADGGEQVKAGGEQVAAGGGQIAGGAAQVASGGSAIAGASDTLGAALASVPDLIKQGADGLVGSLQPAVDSLAGALSHFSTTDMPALDAAAGRMADAGHAILDAATKLSDAADRLAAQAADQADQDARDKDKKKDEGSGQGEGGPAHASGGVINEFAYLVSKTGRILGTMAEDGPEPIVPMGLLVGATAVLGQAAQALSSGAGAKSAGPAGSGGGAGGQGGVSKAPPAAGDGSTSSTSGTSAAGFLAAHGLAPTVDQGAQDAIAAALAQYRRWLDMLARPGLAVADVMAGSVPDGAAAGALADAVHTGVGDALDDHGFTDAGGALAPATISELAGAVAPPAGAAPDLGDGVFNAYDLVRAGALPYVPPVDGGPASRGGLSQLRQPAGVQIATLQVNNYQPDISPRELIRQTVRQLPPKLGAA